MEDLENPRNPRFDRFPPLSKPQARLAPLRRTPLLAVLRLERRGARTGMFPARPFGAPQEYVFSSPVGFKGNLSLLTSFIAQWGIPTTEVSFPEFLIGPARLQILLIQKETRHPDLAHPWLTLIQECPFSGNPDRGTFP